MVKSAFLSDWVRILVFMYNFERKSGDLKDNYVLKSEFSYINFTVIAKTLNITHAHILERFRDVLVPLGLVNVEKVGRSSIVSLTEKGVYIGRRFDEIFVDLKLLR